MAGIEVASVVVSIISAFGNGMDIFRRMTGKRSRKLGRDVTLQEEEAWLRDSLERRPVEIRNSYNRSVARLGHRFEIGDSTAHSSLAHTLLVLNTGLIRLINNVLSNDKKTRDMSRRSLLNLSEVAAADTLNALSQLSLRLDSYAQLALPAPAHRPARDQQTKPRKRGGEVKKRPVPSPLLVRGGWVRPKSGSVVSSSSDSKSIKPINPKHLRSKSDSAVPKTSKALRLCSKTALPSLTQPPVRQEDTFAHRNHSRPHRQPSLLILSSDFFDSYLQDLQTPPPRPPKIPLHSRPNPNLCPRPLSAATFKTTSTKLGEIPEPRWAEQMPSLDVLIQTRPQPYLPPQMEEEPKKRGRGFRFWRREDRRVPVEAY